MVATAPAVGPQLLEDALLAAAAASLLAVCLAKLVPLVRLAVSSLAIPARGRRKSSTGLCAHRDGEASWRKRLAAAVAEWAQEANGGGVVGGIFACLLACLLLLFGSCWPGSRQERGWSLSAPPKNLGGVEWWRCSCQSAVALARLGPA